MGNSEITYFAHLDKERIIDATTFGNNSRFANHTCQNPNAAFHKIDEDTDKEDVPFVSLRTTRAIAIGEEILLNYNEFSKTQFFKKCLCSYH